MFNYSNNEAYTRHHKDKLYNQLNKGYFDQAFDQYSHKQNQTTKYSLQEIKDVQSLREKLGKAQYQIQKIQHKPQKHNESEPQQDKEEQQQYRKNYQSSSVQRTTQFKGQTKVENDEEKCIMFKEILTKIQLAKVKTLNQINQVKSLKLLPFSFEDKCDITNPNLCYDYINESDNETLKLVIKVLYEEIEKIYMNSRGKKYCGIETLNNGQGMQQQNESEEKLRECQQLIDKLTNQLIQKNQQIQVCINDRLHLADKIKAAYWMIEDINKFYKELVDRDIPLNKQDQYKQSRIYDQLNEISTLNKSLQDIQNYIYKYVSEIPKSQQLQQRDVYNEKLDEPQRDYSQQLGDIRQIKTYEDYQLKQCKLESEVNKYRNELSDRGNLKEEYEQIVQLYRDQLRQIDTLVTEKNKLEKELQYLRNKQVEAQKSIIELKEELQYSSVEKQQSAQRFIQETEKSKELFTYSQKNEEKMVQLEKQNHKMYEKLKQIATEKDDLLSQLQQHQQMQYNVQNKEFEVQKNYEVEIKNCQLIIKKQQSQIELLHNNEIHLRSQIEQLQQQCEQQTARFENQNKEIENYQKSIKELELEDHKKQMEFYHLNLFGQTIDGNGDLAKLQPDVKSTINNIFGNNFFKQIEQYIHKAKQYDSTSNIFAGLQEKYKIELIRQLQKGEDIKWLTQVILQTQEILYRNLIDELPSSVIMLREDLEQKKGVFQNKLNDILKEIEELKSEISRISKGELDTESRSRLDLTIESIQQNFTSNKKSSNHSPLQNTLYRSVNKSYTAEKNQKGILNYNQQNKSQKDMMDVDSKSFILNQNNNSSQATLFINPSDHDDLMYMLHIQAHTLEGVFYNEIK